MWFRSTRRTPSPTVPARLRDQRVVVPIMAVAVTFLVIVDGSITTVALPAIAQRFHLSTAGLAGAVVVYPVCLSSLIPASAWLLERYGGRRVLLLNLTLFVVASGLCGAAQNLPQLMAFRALQGMAAGVLTPAAQGLVLRTFTHDEQIRLYRFMIVPQQIAPAVAPLLGGVLVVTLDWRWVFYINVPFGLVAVGFGLLFLAEHRDGGVPRLDLPGLLLSAVAMGALMYGVCMGPDQGWGSAPVLVALPSGAVFLGLAVRHQLRVPEPALRLRLFGDVMFRRSGLVNIVGLVSVMGAMYLVPLFVQQAQGRDALASGSATCTESVGVLLTMQLVGVLYHRVGPGPIVGAGLLGVAGVELLLAGSDAHTGLWTLRLVMFLLGLSMGAFFIPVGVSALTTLDQADAAQAAMLGSVVRQTGLALAPAFVTTTLVLGAGHIPAGAAPPVGAYKHTFLALAGVAVLAGLGAFSLGRRHGGPDGVRDAKRAADHEAEHEALLAGS